MNEPKVAAVNRRPIDILSIGGIDLDLVMTVPRVPGPDEKAIGKLIGRLPGGPVANSACAASRLGLNVSSYCQVGDDQGGRMIIAGFEEYGVETSLIEVRQGEETPFTVILIDPSGEKVIIIVPTFKAHYSRDVLARVLPDTSYLYMLPGDEETFLAVAQEAHKHGTQVMIDIEPDSCSQQQKLERILRHTDIAGFNHFGFVAATGQQPSVAAARSLLASASSAGPHTVIVTLGNKGALAVTEDEAAEHPGFAVSAADTTGAGDTFQAAFLAATIQGKSLAERLRFANGAAALSVMAIGPRGHLPTTTEVEAFLEEQVRDGV